jgi:hypothetical protein
MDLPTTISCPPTQVLPKTSVEEEAADAGWGNSRREHPDLTTLGAFFWVLFELLLAEI